MGILAEGQLYKVIPTAKVYETEQILLDFSFNLFNQGIKMKYKVI